MEPISYQIDEGLSLEPNKLINKDCFVERSIDEAKKYPTFPIIGKMRYLKIY